MHPTLRVFVFSRPLWALAGLLALILVLQGAVELLRKPYDLERIRVKHAAQLQQIFARHDYSWPPQEQVPPLGVVSLPEGLDELRVREKKQLFFRTLLPLVLAENARLREQRSFVLEAFSNFDDLGASARQRLEALARDYRVEGDLANPAAQSKLLRRVDAVPPALVLAQAANESGWGASRFAVRANNLFGVWTYERSAGLKPRQREQDASHYVRVYPSLQRAVRDYMHNLNIGHAYSVLRQQRAAMRAAGEPLDALELAGALLRYSERGADYVTEIRGLIRTNRLNRLGNITLKEY